MLQSILQRFVRLSRGRPAQWHFILSELDRKMSRSILVSIERLLSFQEMRAELI